MLLLCDLCQLFAPCSVHYPAVKAKAAVLWKLLCNKFIYRRDTFFSHTV